MNNIVTKRWESPLGMLILGAIGEEVCLCDWAFNRQRSIIDRRICRTLDAAYIEGNSPTIDKMIGELEEYFAGLRRKFEVQVRFAGSEFQRKVWGELLKIPYGTTVSYAELAERIGNRKAVRAVANANATNPISIIVPCHRVLGSDNALTGYGGGLEVKQALLALESDK